jgi:hypothetical protein
MEGWWVGVPPQTKVTGIYVRFKTLTAHECYKILSGVSEIRLVSIIRVKVTQKLVKKMMKM